MKTSLCSSKPVQFMIKQACAHVQYRWNLLGTSTEHYSVVSYNSLV